jgi:hypothetical protein
MTRRLVIAVVVMLMVLPVAVSAQDEGQETGSIRGVVTNGTEDGEDVAGLEVELLRFEGMDVAEEFTTTVAEDGSYEFSDLPIDQGEAYLASVNYEGVEFRSGMILLTQEPDAER